MSRQPLNVLCNVVLLLALPGILLQVAHEYGRTWTFGGAYGGPVPYLSDDGLTFADGSPIPAATRMWIREGLADELPFLLGVLGLVVIAAVILEVQTMTLRERIASPGLDADEAVRREQDRR